VSNVTTFFGIAARRAGLMLILAGFACTGVVNLVQVQAGDAPNKPLFVLTDTTGHGPAGTIYGFSVIPCGTETPVWQLVASGTNGAPSRFAYGDSIPGYVTRIGPLPLRSGCYDVFVTDGRRVRFHVDAAGHVQAAR
jgi:hypothetical protein